MLQMMMLSITRGTMKFPPLAILCPCSLLFGYVFVELHDIPVLSEAQHIVTIVSNHTFNLCHIILIWGAGVACYVRFCAVPFSFFNFVRQWIPIPCRCKHGRDCRCGRCCGCVPIFPFKAGFVNFTKRNLAVSVHVKGVKKTSKSPLLFVTKSFEVSWTVKVDSPPVGRDLLICSRKVSGNGSLCQVILGVKWKCVLSVVMVERLMPILPLRF